MLWRMVCCALSSVGLLFCGTSALADVVGPPPEECENGGEPNSSHCGAYCSVRACAADEECGEGMTCEELELCIRQLDCMSSGGPFSVDSVEDSCAGGEACVVGECRALMVCADYEPVGVPRQAGCGCRAGGSGGTQALVVALFAAALGLFVRLSRSRGA